MYKQVVKPLLFRMDPEFVHDRALTAGKVLGSNPLTRGIVRMYCSYEHPALRQKIRGILFENPVGLSAGFDKNCELLKIIPAVGFGFEEVGSITAEPYAGNPGVRLVRLPKDQSIIVYYGLKNKGARVLREKLKGKHAIPIGISIAKTNKEFKSLKEKLDDWERGVKLLKDCGDYLTINVSCPNTFDPQNFNDPELLAQLLERIKGIKFAKPVFLKLTADLSPRQLDDIIEICDRHRFITGFILTNLVKDRTKLRLKSKKEEYAHHKGGLSGKIVQPRALALVRHAYARAGERYIIIGCGGIFTAEDAYKYIRGGASLLQLITGMIYGGPRTVRRINKGLVALLERDGYVSISDAIGADVRQRQRPSARRSSPKAKGESSLP